MILSVQQIQSIIKDNPNKALVANGVNYNKKLRMHIYGEGLKSEMTKMDGFESEDLNKLRVTYARSNKDLFSRLSRPMDKVFSAKGGSVYYNLPDSQDKQARLLSLDVRNGISARKWVEMYWLAHMKDDPFGIVFMEILPIQDALLAKRQGRSFVYPTYKSITSVYDYLPKGSQLDYVVFNVSTQEKKNQGIDEKKTIYRVVDDAYDYYVEKEGENVRILSDHSYPNYFGYVPGMINSDLVSPQDEDCYLSFFDDIIELAQHFLLYGSVRLSHDFLHAYPKYWQYATACSNCGGHGKMNGEDCESCKGTGKALLLKVSDAMLLEFPSKDDQKITPDVAGYVSPDKTFYEISTANIQTLEELMNVTLWGSGSKVKTQGSQVGADGQPKTATEVVDEMKPQADRLNIISEMAEKRHKFIMDNVIKINLSLPAYRGSSVNYGRRYMLEGHDEVWDKYSNARSKGSPISVLEDLLIEYYESKYQGDAISLAIAMKLMYVEPFVHLTSQQVDSSASITAEDKAAKAYFGEWLSTVNEAMILSMSVELLRTNLADYANQKATAIQDAKAKELEQQNSFKTQQAA